MIKAVVFDMDGVLVDSERVYIDQLADKFKELEIDLGEKFLMSLIGLNDKMVVETIHPHTVPVITGQAFLDEVHADAEANPINFKELMMNGVYEIITHFKSRGYKLGLASSSPKPLIIDVLKQCEIYDFFDVITSGDEFKESKPNPEIYEKTLERLGVSAREAIVLEDSEHGITSAKAAGIFTVGLKDTRFGINQEQADRLVKSLDELIEVVDEIESEVE